MRERPLLLLVAAVLLGVLALPLPARTQRYRVADVEYVLDQVSVKTKGDKPSDQMKNCATCEAWVTGALQNLPDGFSYDELRQQLALACGSKWVRKYKQTYVTEKNFRHGFKHETDKTRILDMNARCLTLLNTAGDLATDLVSLSCPLFRCVLSLSLTTPRAPPPDLPQLGAMVLFRPCAVENVLDCGRVQLHHRHAALDGARQHKSARCDSLMTDVPGPVSHWRVATRQSRTQT